MAFNKKKAVANGDKYFAAQKFDKALSEYQKISKADPNDLNILNKIGDTYSKLGNKASAISFYVKVAEGYRRAGFYPKAIALYRKMNRIDPDYMEARDRLVDLYLQQGHHSEAKAELRNIAEFFYQKNLLSRALTYYERVTELDPRNLEARMKVTELLVKEGKRDQAGKHFIDMGRDLIEKKMISEARKILTQAVKFDPENPEIKILFARSLIEEGEMDEGIRQLTDICTRYPENVDAVKILGSAYVKQSKLEEAAACFIRALHLDERATRPLEDLAASFIDSGKLDSAFNVIEPVASLFLKNNKFDEATRLYRNILYANDNHIPSHKKLVNIYKLANQYANAVLSLEHIINHHLQEKQIPEAQEQIERLLTLEPNNLQWRTKLEALKTGGMPDDLNPASEPSILDEEDTGLLEGDQQITDLGSLNDEEDLESTIQNHLTEADVFIKYNIYEKALAHLSDIVAKDPENFEAHTRLRQIYLEQNDGGKAVASILVLVKRYTDQGDYERANDLLREAETLKPGSGRELQGKLAAIESESTHGALEEMAEHRAAFGEGFPLRSGNTLPGFSLDQGESDVLDFSNMNAEKPADSEEMEPSLDFAPAEVFTDDAGWSLDIPQVPMDDDEDAVEADHPSVVTQPTTDDHGGVADLADMLRPDSAEDEELSPGEPKLEFLDEKAPELEFLAEPDADLDIEDEDEEVLDPSSLEEDEDSAGFITNIPPDQMDASLRLDFVDEDEAIDDIPEDVDASLVFVETDEDEAVDEIPEDVDAALEFVETDEAEDGEEYPTGPVTDMDDGHDGVLDPTALADAAPELEVDADEAEIPVLADDDLSSSGILELEDSLEELPDDLDTAEVEPAAGGNGEGLQESRLAGELDEIDFFLSMEAFNDAESLLKDSIQRFGEQPALMERLARIKQSQEGNKAEAPPLPVLEGGSEDDDLLNKDSGFFDLAAELGEELFEDSGEVNDQTTQEEVQSVEELFKEFKRGVDEQIDANDFETHYDLGIAYKEMGLLQESISEFEKAIGDRSRFLECTTMIGSCFIEMGDPDRATRHFEDALKLDDLKEGEAKAIKYELGLAFEGQGNLERALEVFKEVESMDPNYRDLQSRLAALA